MQKIRLSSSQADVSYKRVDHWLSQWSIVDTAGRYKAISG
ncbi:hypothetical protein CLOSTMETH_00222 [[Clostridium] methylpentosum DSM 5476]|uniref:Uncharacterized protein n=1 Tax=[Clostridium] methylpentosum DSM 5476 TaxID=537013 RepID=C0E8S7_9FIRM|nr:hypothetical protein CLOSTMETH_00222 [[Clostridium] methylpentosum DSM 5476]